MRRKIVAKRSSGMTTGFFGDVECPRCGALTDIHIFKHWGCATCGYSELDPKGEDGGESKK